MCLKLRDVVIVVFFAGSRGVAVSRRGSAAGLGAVGAAGGGASHGPDQAAVLGQPARILPGLPLAEAEGVLAEPRPPERPLGTPQ